MPHQGDQAAPRHAMLVLGMHRSGTSATAGLLAHLGAATARTPMPADPYNPAGYWESEALMRFHDRLLAARDSAWDDWSRLDPAWSGTAESRAFAAELADLVVAEFGDAPLILVKDPRICRFVPLWLQVLEGLAIVPKVVIPLRDPAAVASSLAHRDGTSTHRALLLWLRHVLDAERATRDLPRSFLRYADLLADWRGTVDRLAIELDIRWPHPPDEAAQAIDGFIARDLAHPPPPEPPALPPLIAETRRALDRLVRADASGLSRLDALGATFDAAIELIGPEVGDLRAKAETLREMLAGHESTAGVLRAEIATARAAAASHARAADNLRDQHEAANERAEKLTERVHDLEAEIATVRASRSWRMTRPLRAVESQVVKHRPAPAEAPTTAAEPGPKAAPALAAKPRDFDPWFYLSFYPDVAASGMDPYEHYRQCGKAEGRLARPPR